MMPIRSIYYCSNMKQPMIIKISELKLIKIIAKFGIQQNIPGVE